MPLLPPGEDTLEFMWFTHRANQSYRHNTQVHKSFWNPTLWIHDSCSVNQVTPVFSTNKLIILYWTSDIRQGLGQVFCCPNTVCVLKRSVGLGSNETITWKNIISSILTELRNALRKGLALCWREPPCPTVHPFWDSLHPMTCELLDPIQNDFEGTAESSAMTHSPTSYGPQLCISPAWEYQVS
jgi:hypothetical protein